MKRKLMALLAVGAASAAAFGGTAVLAGSDSADDKAEVQAFLGSAHSISAAIGAAEASSGGKAVAAEFDHKDGAAFYEVDTIANGKQISVEIDAASGKVIKSADEGDVAKAEDDDIVDPAQLGATLTDLVARAEQKSGAKVMAISAEHGKGPTPTIEVEVAKPDGSTQEFAMAQDGSLTPVADGDDGESDEHDG